MTIKRLLSICCLLAFSMNVFSAGDRLTDAYDQSHNTMAEPYSVNAEADDLFDTQIDLWGTISNAIDGDPDTSGIALSDSIFVRATRFLIRLTIVIGVPMLIFVWIKIALALGDEWKLKEALKLAGYVWAGILLALLSVMIIYLASSLTRSSLWLI